MKKLTDFYISHTKEATKKPRNYPGMFDLIRGWCIVGIILLHTFTYFNKYQFSETGYAILTAIKALLYIPFFGSCAIPVFFIISGFGFSKSKISVMLKKQAGYLMKPYAYTALISGLLCTLVCVFSKEGIVYSGKRFIYTVLGFVLGRSDAFELNEQTVYGSYACWFLLALFIGGTILNLVKNLIPEKYQALVLLLIAFVGVNIHINYFALSASLVTPFYLYLGTCLKEGKILNRKTPVSLLILTPFILIINMYFGPTQMSIGVYGLNILDVIMTSLAAIPIINMILYLNRYHNILFDIIRTIGRYSLWIICIHTVEYIAFPWSRLLGHLTSHSLINLFIVLIVRIILITVGLEFLILYNTKVKKLLYRR